MGTWGFKSFENDNAGDWVWELEKQKDLKLVRETLSAVFDEEDETVGSDAAELAIAAAEVVSAMKNRDYAHLPEEAAAWAKKHEKQADADLIEEAREAVARVAADSELRDLYEEAGNLAEWQRELEALVARLR